MAIIWMDDPSFYNAAEFAVRYALTVSNTPTINATGGRFGTPSWQPATSGNPSTWITPSFTSIATGTAAFSLKLAAYASGNFTIMQFLDSGTLQCDLRITPSGNLIVTRNGTQIGSTSTNNLSLGVWYRIEFQITINNSTGNIEVRVNGTSVNWIPSTGSLNTRNTANSSFNAVALGTANNTPSAAANLNDLVITDNNSPNAGYLGDKRCYLRVPSSDSSVAWTPAFASWAASTVEAVGNQIEDSNGNVQRVQSITGDFKTGGSAPSWATTGGSTTVDNHVTWVVVGSGSNPGALNWMAVSENPSDGDNSYNASSSASNVDLFGLPSLPAGAANIVGVNNVLYARKDDAGTRTIESQISSSGSVANGATVGLSTSYAYIDFISNVDPHTSSAWTVAGANALLVGYEEVT